jgi:hypothetical protein
VYRRRSYRSNHKAIVTLTFIINAQPAVLVMYERDTILFEIQFKRQWNIHQNNQNTICIINNSYVDTCGMNICYIQSFQVFGYSDHFPSSYPSSHSLDYAVYVPWSDGPPLTGIFTAPVKSRDSVCTVYCAR